MIDLLIGKTYRVRTTKGVKAGYPAFMLDFKGEIIYLDDEIVVFDNGKFKISQMVKDYKKLWRAS